MVPMKNTSHTFLVVLATGRVDRESERVAKAVKTLVEAAGHKAPLVDVRDYPSPVTVPSWVESEIFTPWRELAEQADGYVLVVPEYNHSFPGELKILLDSAHKEYKHKPFGIVGVSGGATGGARVIEHLKPLVSGLGGNCSTYSAMVPHVKDALRDDCTFTDGSVIKRIEGMIADVAYFSDNYTK